MVKIMTNKKYLKTIVNGVISKLITLNESYINEGRLFNAIDFHCKNFDNSPLNQSVTQAAIDKALMSLFISRTILPDVVNGNGFIIALNCEDAIASAKELYERSVSITSPAMVCSPVALYSLEDAKENLKKLDPQTKSVVEDIAHNYVENYLDCKDVFPEFSK